MKLFMPKSFYVFSLPLLYLCLFCAFSQADGQKTRDRNQKPYKVVCYFASWTSFFTAEDINPHVCTHINYAFATLENNQISVWNPKNLIARMMALRKRNPQLTFLLSIGGWADGTDKYSEMVRDAANRKIFIRSVLDVLREHDFDGLDFDWEFPGYSGENRTLGRAEDKRDLIFLFRDLKRVFRPRGLLLTAALTHSKRFIDRGYHIPALNKYLDFINLMTYDYAGSWSRGTGHNSPLYARPAASDEDRRETIAWTVDYFLRNGADPRKLILGIPLYSLKFRLATERDNGVNAPVAKFLHGDIYAKYCNIARKPGWRVRWDRHAMAPYAYNDREWISFEAGKSIKAKLNFVRKRRLGGVMVWEVNGDDHRGVCGRGPFPMLRYMMRSLNP